MGRGAGSMKPDFQTYNLTNFKLTPAERGEVSAAGHVVVYGPSTLRFGSWTIPLFPKPW